MKEAGGTMATLIPEYKVTVETLDGLFKRAFFKTRIDEDGDIYVTDGPEFPIWVRIDADRKLIMLFTYMRRNLDERPPYTEKSANLLNATVALPSFHVISSEPRKLYATCYASYEDGIIDSQIIGLARRFAGAAVYGARKLDEPVLH